ncbi:MAG: TlpA disulfide reductase family protein [Muribaculaceae bacterium]|nr:TlpA family protein disulfide reductase [Muribaculaceae bacterium]MCI6494079.1 TlpA family protein disulfide reductase [Bacteroidales bacterium]MDD6701676.1 TlpA disulfide reductase family protein [Bacteroidales bacterium]MDD6942431.1 TlpA disulfide reductase family protein [Bacteroidales bacterium]MDY2733209.1 TlpA disulfide reductase family protein [Muribaculaceae bacterium]
MKRIERLLVMAMVSLGIAIAANAQLPSVQLKDLNGKPVDSATLSNDGKPFVISFWATWCKPCIRELMAFHEVYEDWVEETGVKIYAISIDEAQNSTKVKPLADARGWEYEILLDQSGDFARSLGCQNPPHLVILDGNGKIVESHSGYTEGSEDHVYEIIKNLVNKE